MRETAADGSTGHESAPGRRVIRWRRTGLWLAAAAVILFLLYLFPFCYTIRAVWLPWQSAESVEYRGREFRGGRDVPAAEIEGETSIGRALWPDGKAYHAPGYDPSVGEDYIPTVIIVETPAGSNHFRSYSLVGGP